MKTESEAAPLPFLTLPAIDCKSCTASTDKLERFAMTMRAQSAVLAALLDQVDGMTRDEIIDQVGIAVRATETLAAALLFAA